MKTIRVNASSKSYDIILGRNIIASVLKERTAGYAKAAVICDENVAPLYLDRVLSALPGAVPIIIKAGEEHKNLQTVLEIYNELAKAGLSRKDAVIALGGGVTGDISGFAAATYLRGIAYIQVPTTLLAQVDSSIGGKTGVDLPSGKNLVGAFKQPELVVIDFEVLQTLPPEQISSGMAEIIKCGMIKDAALIERLEASGDFEENLEYFITSAITVKKDVVEKDEFEKGDRMLLNFGHTFGHSIEKNMGFTGITHGQAVAIGMYLITETPETKELLKRLFVKYGLSWETDIPMNEIIKGSMNDKKASADGINLIFAEQPGCGCIKKMTKKEIQEAYGNS